MITGWLMAASLYGSL